jgi:hypothetical protein
MGPNLYDESLHITHTASTHFGTASACVNARYDCATLVALPRGSVPAGGECHFPTKVTVTQPLIVASERLQLRVRPLCGPWQSSSVTWILLFD